MKSESMEIRVRSEEKEAFKRAAELSGVSLSAWARERLRLAAIRELEGVGLQVPFVRSLLIK